MIKLDFYRRIPELHPIGVDDEPDPDCNYTSYRVFVLESRLFPLIYGMFPNKNLEIVYSSRYNSERDWMDIYLVIRELENTTEPLVINKEISLTEEEKEKIVSKIYEISSKYPNYALIDLKELYKSRNVNVSKKDTKGSVYSISSKIPQMPFSWFSKAIEYTGLDSSYNPFIRPEGIYLSFNPNSDFNSAYNEVCSFLISRINEFYQKGVIILDSINDSVKKEKFILDWKLIPLDEEEPEKKIYQPDWNDYRFAENMVDFLTRKMTGDEFIRLKVSDNFVKRFGIVKELEGKELIFEGSYLKVKVENLEEAQEVADKVERGMEKNGKVLVLPASRKSYIYLYFEYAKKKNWESLMYMVFSLENPYYFSSLLPENEETPLDILREEFRNYATERLVEISKISKLKNMSPHDIIISEYEN